MIERRGGWLSMVFRTHGSVVKVIWPRLLVTTAISILFMQLKPSFPVIDRSLTITPFLVTALPLGIILGFRNTSSYDRFWEGRKLWGSLVNSARSFLRQSDAYIRAQSSEEVPAAQVFKKEVGYRILAFAHAMRMHLRGEKTWDDLAPFLLPDELEALRTEPSPPAAILHRVGLDIALAQSRGWLESRHVPILEASLVTLTDVLGGCERIKSTPTPISYLIFIHRAVAFYCFLLPLGVHETVKTLTPVVVFFVSYAFFSLDAIGDELDDPFKVSPNGLPLATIARNIEIYGRKRLGETTLPKPLAPVNDVLR